MSFAGVRNALDQYSQNAVRTGIESASPHRLIQMLLEGALGKIAAAKGHMERGAIQPKGEQIGSAISILEGLKSSLDKDKGGEIAQNLEDLYIYMERRLIEANRSNDTSLLDEVSDLLKQIKEAWEAIANQASHLEPSA
ncbi:MAG: flagellar export chaperone FliS [Gammaproteobacteria bacterium]|nr:MAG: flagellar export chaperone FliS [Gammaproteobacteria bacterium]